ncbi:PIG-L deacetylase family protein [Tannerella forsythia]|uniref:PIG-L deacetylase family protein n=1 Tax=Tannerella forsythia TaxID=28112 RepID=UPI0028E980F9|nr:PIG-L deacetylase family protein [Tannerella forsythia]
MKKILCVSVHPDDETLGCGGTLLKHKATGDEIYCVHVTNGNERQESVIRLLRKLYGFKETYQLGLPEIKLTDIPLSEIIGKLSAVIQQVKPDYLYIPNRSDAHSDHRIVFEALTACTKSFRYPFIKKIMMCEVISETDFSPALPENIFIPNVFMDISDFIERKYEILNVFESELLTSPYTRSIDAILALSKYRGSQINVNYAEAFMLLKEVC